MRNLILHSVVELIVGCGMGTLQIYAQSAPSVENLHELLKNLFTWLGLQRGTLKAQSRAVDLHTMIRRNLTLFIPAAERKQVILRSQVEPETLVHADPDMVYAIFRNFISNTIKFTFPGDNVTITAVQQNHMMEVAIADTGVGISRIWGESEEGTGTTFRFTLPLTANHALV